MLPKGRKNIITNKELAKKVESRTGMRAYEVLTALSAVAEIILEETAENNRIQLEADGGALVSIYPQCAGLASDKDVLADPENRWSSESRAKRLAA